mmetsp:Transcript_9983/g.27299  ORF Transcript_9983/g.27299 Transcript_9983/m.27299 type:complete len:215 (+) Transcript_9983:570-1214(+)
MIFSYSCGRCRLSSNSGFCPCFASVFVRTSLHPWLFSRAFQRHGSILISPWPSLSLSLLSPPPPLMLLSSHPSNRCQRRCRNRCRCHRPSNWNESRRQSRSHCRKHRCHQCPCRTDLGGNEVSHARWLPCRSMSRPPYRRRRCRQYERSLPWPDPDGRNRPCPFPISARAAAIAARLILVAPIRPSSRRCDRRRRPCCEDLACSSSRASDLPLA